jgi:translocator protein
MEKVWATIVAPAAVAAAQAAGARYNPSPTHPRTAAWYGGLNKPSFTPPGPVFGIAWTLIDSALSYGGYRLLRARPSTARTGALALWALNVLGVGGYSWVMFGRKRLDEATGVTGAMLATSVGAVALASQVDRKAAWAILPLAGWVAFAFILQEEVWRRNR